jgi:hypothetical protein
MMVSLVLRFWQKVLPDAIEQVPCPCAAMDGNDQKCAEDVREICHLLSDKLDRAGEVV